MITEKTNDQKALEVELRLLGMPLHDFGKIIGYLIEKPYDHYATIEVMASKEFFEKHGVGDLIHLDDDCAYVKSCVYIQPHIRSYSIKATNSVFDLASSLREHVKRNHGFVEFLLPMNETSR